MGRVSKLELQRTITDIMKKGDLDQLTTKKIRLLCEEKYNVDLTSRKEEIDKVVMNFINKHCSDQKSTGSGSSSYESEDSSCSSKSCSDSDCSYSSAEESEQKKPVDISVKHDATKKVPHKPATSKKPKKIASHQAKTAAGGTAVQKSKEASTKKAASEVDDEAFARQLQAEEWNFRRRTVDKSRQNRSQRKGDKNEQAKRKKASAFMKKCLLSPALAEVLGTAEMSRPDVVQKMWSIVRERNLFDTSNKQYAICDEQLYKIFGKKRIRVIGMMKYLKKHIKDVKDLH